ncbi:Outer membrane protein [Elusimicrobium minutum Pei191]|uniref:Outer membrane protein n=1 Tax=Elusimicrobium minutum (strain Pei191) TaxID=445932 RepID=B2KCY1_ELUMP|nr:outer membrane beta-barrel protein [Elusimicrobium minutum]ACC98377.1 Outer membrane protein [Elusimicrobium minutum Pei191]
MKKIIAVLFVGMLISTSAFANEFGFGFKLGATQKKTNIDKFKDSIQPYMRSTDLTENNFVYGLEGFYEYSLNNDASIGVKLGFEGISKDELEGVSLSNLKYDVEITSSVLPLTVYYKYNLNEKFNVWGGAGVSMVFAKLKDGMESYKENKVFPHINAGVEWRISQMMGLGFDARYSFSSKIDKWDGTTFYATASEKVMLDLDGINAGLTLRFYF